MFRFLYSVRKYKAFTLAEVLISIGIIGILAALMIPSLMKSITASKFSAQFQQALSSLNQAAKMAQGNFDIDYAAANQKCNIQNARQESAGSVYTFCSLYNSTLAGASYLGLLSDISGYSVRVRSSATSNIFETPVFAEDTEQTVRLNTDMSNYLGYSLANGSLVAFHKDAEGCALRQGELLTSQWAEENPQCIGFIDVNGVAGPNTVVNCDDVDPLEINPNSVCNLNRDKNHITDIYPVLFYNSSTTPATPAAKSVATTWKSTSITDRNGQN